eukprot:6458809-Amphidinium_carterae.2
MDSPMVVKHILERGYRQAANAELVSAARSGGFGLTLHYQHGPAPAGATAERESSTSCTWRNGHLLATVWRTLGQDRS